MSQRITLESLTKYSVISNCQTEECQKQEGQLVDCHTYVEKIDTEVSKLAETWDTFGGRRTCCHSPDRAEHGPSYETYPRKCKTKALIYKLGKVKVTFLCPWKSRCLLRRSWIECELLAFRFRISTTRLYSNRSQGSVLFLTKVWILICSSQIWCVYVFWRAQKTNFRVKDP